MTNKLINSTELFSHFAPQFKTLAKPLKGVWSVNLTPYDLSDDGDNVVIVFSVNFYLENDELNFSMDVLYDSKEGKLGAELSMEECIFSGDVSSLVEALTVLNAMKKSVMDYSDELVNKKAKMVKSILLV